MVVVGSISSKWLASLLRTSASSIVSSTSLWPSIRVLARHYTPDERQLAISPARTKRNVAAASEAWHTPSTLRAWVHQPLQRPAHGATSIGCTPALSAEQEHVLCCRVLSERLPRQYPEVGFKNSLAKCTINSVAEEERWHCHTSVCHLTNRVHLYACFG